MSSVAGFDFPGDLVAVVDGECVEVGGTDGRRDAGIFPAHVPVVALSKSPLSAGTMSTCIIIGKNIKMQKHVRERRELPKNCF